MVAKYTLQWQGQEGIPLIWNKVDWNRLFFYFGKRKIVSSNDMKDIGRGAGEWEAKEGSRARKRKEKDKETEKGKIKVRKRIKKTCEVFFPSNLVWVM